MDPVTLVEFLSARLTEDAAAWRRAATEGDYAKPHGPGCDYPGDRPGTCTCNLLEQLQVDVDAKRRSIDLLTYSSTGKRSPIGRDQEQILRLMASMYADHPDYRDEWRP